MERGFITAWQISALMRLHFAHKFLNAAAKFGGFTGKQKTPQPALLSANNLGSIGSIEYLAEILATSQPRTDPGKIAEIIHYIAKIHARYMHLATFRELHTTSQNFPAGIFCAHHFSTCIDI